MANTMWTDQIPTVSQQLLLQQIAVVGTIGDQRLWPFLPRDLVEDSFDLRDLRTRSKPSAGCEWSSLSSRHIHVSFYNPW